MVYKKSYISGLLFIVLVFFSSQLSAATIYVDNSLSSDCNNNYSIASRNCNGSDGSAYNVLQEAINAMSAGDHIELRGGTYIGCTKIPTSKNGDAWTEGNYNKVSSYPGEWAILDGNKSCSANYSHEVIGNSNDDLSGGGDLKYWIFERLEIKNGGTSNNPNGPGIWINGGPFKIRYCYIHDNGKGQPGVCDYASTATMGFGWRNSTIEYNYFKDNGSSGGSNNCKQIAWDESYSLTDAIEQNGLSLNENTGVATSNGISNITNYGNVIQYNYVSGGVVGIAPKHFVFRTGRSTTQSNYSDTYKDKGTKIHHNIIKNVSGYGIGAHGDFDQIYNNIIDSPESDGIRAMYDYWTDDSAYSYMYKVTAYNNTIIDPGTHVGYLGMGRRWANWINPDWYGYIYNNICDNCGSGVGNYSYEAGITPKVRHSGETRAMTYDNGVISNNYFYRPRNTSLYNTFYNTVYSDTAWETQTDTASQKVSFAQSYSAGNPLYLGTTGADKYKVNSSHTVEGINIMSAGIGNNHPYLAGVTLPSYVGAVNPDDQDWVVGIINNITSTSWLRNQVDESPDWIEGNDSGGSVSGPSQVKEFILISQ